MSSVRLDSGQYMLKWMCYFVNTMSHHRATVNLYLLQTDRKIIFLQFFSWISKYLSTGAYFIQFGSELVQIWFLEFTWFICDLFYLKHRKTLIRQEFPKRLYHKFYSDSLTSLSRRKSPGLHRFGPHASTLLKLCCRRGWLSVIWVSINKLYWQYDLV